MRRRQRMDFMVRPRRASSRPSPTPPVALWSRSSIPAPNTTRTRFSFAHIRSTRRRLRRWRQSGHAPRQALTNLRAHVESLGAVFSPDAAAGVNAPILVGRYSEDAYCLGNVRRRLLRSR
jgi:hypothetical protein